MTLSPSMFHAQEFITWLHSFVQLSLPTLHRTNILLSWLLYYLMDLRTLVLLIKISVMSAHTYSTFPFWKKFYPSLVRGKILSWQYELSFERSWRSLRHIPGGVFAQGSFLVKLRGSYGTLGIKPRLTTYKANTLSVVLSCCSDLECLNFILFFNVTYFWHTDPGCIGK